jgi:hypothetical protein
VKQVESLEQFFADKKKCLIIRGEGKKIDSLVTESEEKEKEFLQVNSYDGDIHMKIFKSIKYYYIKKYIEPEEKEKKEKRKPTYFPKEFLKKIYDDIDYNFETNRLFKPANSYILFLEKNDLKDSSSVKKCYKNIYYQIKNKKYYVNERE